MPRFASLLTLWLLVPWSSVAPTLSPPCPNHPANTCDMGFFYIQSSETALVLDVNGRNRTASTPVIMYAYKGSANQLWYFSNHVLYSKLNGMVLDANPDGQLVIDKCVGTPNQLWFFEGDNIRSGKGKFLDSKGCKEQVITSELQLGRNQKFRIIPV